MWLVPVYGWGVVRQPRAIYVWPEDPRPKRPTDTRDVWMFDTKGRSNLIGTVKELAHC